MKLGKRRHDDTDKREQYNGKNRYQRFIVKQHKNEQDDNRGEYDRDEHEILFVPTLKMRVNIFLKKV